MSRFKSLEIKNVTARVGIKSRRAADGKSPRISALILLCIFLGCKEEIKVIYTERVGILPDGGGLMLKELRSDASNRSQLVLLESVGNAKRDIFALPLTGFEDVKFQSTVSGDTLVLFHSQPRLAAGLVPIVKSSFPVRFVLVTGAASVGAGTDEGADIFYAPGKWKAYLELSRKK